MPPNPEMTVRAAKRRVQDSLRERRTIHQADLNLIQAAHPQLYQKVRLEQMIGRATIGSSSVQSATANTSTSTASATPTNPSASKPKTPAKKDKRKRDVSDESESEDSTPAKTSTSALKTISNPSKILLERFEEIDDGEKDVEEDIGAQIGEHLIPIGVLKNDPEPKRAVFASLNRKEELDYIAFPMDKRFRSFRSTKEHENNFKSYQSFIHNEAIIRGNVTFHNKIPQKEFRQIREYVFDKMKKSEPGKKRVKPGLMKENHRRRQQEITRSI
jgi:hypothetical protein